ncbi:telomerase reverse transcriptase-like isoform X3 [Portunus trituberculatus]|nr:telomerase reverse transcriptase-like isoform X3 [Portunus trituberculatus]
MKSGDLLDLLKMSPFCKDGNDVKEELLVNNNSSETEYGNTSKGTVFHVLNVALNSIVPQSTWGNQDNYSRMEFFLWQLVDMGLRETMSIGVLLDGMKLEDMRWAKELPLEQKVYIVSKFFVWIVEKIIIVTLKSVFYQTEMSSGGYQIFFFPKNKIDSLMQKTVNSICEVMPLESVVKGVIRKILPKKSGGVRPLFRETAIHKKSRTLFEAKQLLRYLANKEQKRIASFPEVWQNALYMLGKESKLYFVKTDIKDAFSSVDVPQLLVQLYQVCKNLKTLEFIKYSKGRKELNIPVDITKDLSYKHLKNFKKQSHFTINVHDILLTIEASLQPCVLYNKLKIKVAEGLPQGCFLSLDLCEFYYARMTSLYLDDLQANNEGIIIRVVDDFLFLSKSLEKAQEFRFRMMKGIKEFNCHINLKKTDSNIDYQKDRIHFNGYIICMSTKSLLINVSDLTKVPPRYSLTFETAGNMKEFISNKLFIISKNRLQRHMIDPRSADSDTFLSNVWRVGIHCGAKLQALCQVCDTYGKFNNSSMYVRAVLNLSKGTFKRITSYKCNVLGENIFISLLVCSIYHSFSRMAQSSFEILQNKLRTLALNHLAKVTEAKEQKLKDDLLSLLESSVSGQ